MKELNIKIEDFQILSNIVGEKDRNLTPIRYHFHTNIIVNHSSVLVDDFLDDLTMARIENVFNTLIYLSSHHIALKVRDVKYITEALESVDKDELVDFYLRRKEILRTYNGKPIYPKTLNQEQYLKVLNENDVIISTGVAGVGKTYVAVCDAVRNLRLGNYKKIILSRPVVEAGESLGYLPGDLKEKIDPYLIPLYDALYDLMGKRTTDELIDEGVIEIAPLAYMRGRTLEDAYVILDEAQNTTRTQMKLFLTRLGFNTKMVVTGDLTQIDLPKTSMSGMGYAIERLDSIKGLKIFTFDIKDVVRNPLVERIIERLQDD